MPPITIVRETIQQQCMDHTSRLWSDYCVFGHLVFHGMVRFATNYAIPATHKYTCASILQKTFYSFLEVDTD